MSRLDRERLSKGTFPFHCEIATRFTDVDMLGHINNVATAGLLQEGRTRFAYGCGLVGLMKGRSTVVVSIAIDYVGELRHPDPVQMAVGVLAIGRTSCRFGQVVSQHGRIGTFAETVLVVSLDGQPVPFDEEWRAKLESLMIGAAR